MPPKTAQELFDYFSNSRIPSQEDFPVGKMFQILKDPFGLWCHFHAPKTEAVEEPNIYENLRGKTDRLNRDTWIYEHCKTPITISGEDLERFKKTLFAMEQGADGIIGATLWDLRPNHQIYGSVNFLLKVNEGKSIFGDYHYKIIQLKRASEMKEHYALQTSLLNNILTNIQGYEAQNALFVFKNKTQLLDCRKVLERASKSKALYHKIRLNQFCPETEKPPKAAMSPWRVYANKYVVSKHDIVLIPHLSSAMRDVLRANNINTYEDLFLVGLDKVKTLLAEPVADDKTAILAYAHAKSFVYNKPIIRNLENWKPFNKKRNLYFDFEATETFTADSISFIYLIGVWDKEKDKFVSFVAREEKEEEKIFKQFADYIANDEVALYHWTEYEVKKMRALQSKYPNIKDDLQKLINACIDLKIVVEKSFYLPSPSLSLKAAAPAFGFAWRQTDCGAMDSMVYFTKWLNTGDETALKKVLMYNEDDCVAMLYIENALNKYLSENKVLPL